VLQAKVSTKGQVTLPKSVRESLSIRQGDRIEFSLDSKQGVKLRRMQPPGSSAGCAKRFLKCGQKNLTHTEERAFMLNEVGAKYGDNI